MVARGKEGERGLTKGRRPKVSQAWGESCAPRGCKNTGVKLRLCLINIEQEKAHMCSAHTKIHAEHSVWRRRCSHGPDVQKNPLFYYSNTHTQHTHKTHERLTYTRHCRTLQVEGRWGLEVRKLHPSQTVCCLAGAPLHIHLLFCVRVCTVG